MIPHVRKGGDMRGLVQYLQGPGRANDHREPHVIGGEPFLTAWYGTEELDRAAANEIADYLDEPRRLYGVEMRGQVTTQDPETGNKVVLGYEKRDTWHCSLSVAPEDGVLPETQWQQIADEFMDRMEFTEASGKAPARWVAIHHGLSGQGDDGQDHIHIAASMVREDGTRWAGQYQLNPETGKFEGDYEKVQRVCRQLEREHGLTAVDGRERDAFERADGPAAQARAQRRRLTVPERSELGGRLRRAAVASQSEAEWIRRVRADGVVLKPHWARGTNDVAAGYKAGLKPHSRDEKLVMIGGGNVADDLSLGRIRENWPAPTVQQADAAAAEWQTAFRGQPPAERNGRETKPLLGEKTSETAHENFAAFNDRLAAVPIGDHAQWADAARDVSGVLSSWARYESDPANREQLSHAARALGRSAQLERPAGPAGRRAKESPMGTALLFMQARRQDQPKVAGGMLLAQVVRTVAAVRDYHKQRGNAREANRVHSEAVARLEKVQLTGYRDAPPVISERDQAAHEAHRVASQGQRTGTGAQPPTTSPAPLPNTLPTRANRANTKTPAQERSEPEREW